MDVTNDTGNYRHAITKSLHKNKEIKIGISRKINKYLHNKNAVQQKIHLYIELQNMYGCRYTQV